MKEAGLGVRIGWGMRECDKGRMERVRRGDGVGRGGIRVEGG